MAPPKRKVPPRAAAGAKKRPTGSSSRRRNDTPRLRNRLLIGGLLIVLAGVVVFAAARPGNDTSIDDQLATGAGSCAVDREFDEMRPGQGIHVPKPTYEVDPPSGGSHLDTAAKPGFYRPKGDTIPPDGELVHAQEHGFVVLWYRPDVPAETMTQLERLSDTFGRELILVPRASLTGEVAVTAWHRRLLCGSLVPEKVALFTREHVNKGPEKGFL